MKNAPADFVVPASDDEDSRPAVEPVKEASSAPSPSSPEAIFEDLLKQGLQFTQGAIEQAKALDGTQMC